MTDEKHLRLSDDELEKKFETTKLSPMHFTHEAHLRLAYIHIMKYGLDKAIENLRSQIKHYALRYGATMKYNETVTVASARIMHHFMDRYQGESFQDFIAHWPRLKTDFKGLISQHYSGDIFRSPEAKAHYQEPDLQHF